MSEIPDEARTERDDVTQTRDPAVAAGGTIGPYRVLTQLGEGGMGQVWLAEQMVPIGRHVALKIIKPGMDTAQVIARFEAERQALALMDHPQIAKVLDAGATPRVVPYFAMELVRGVPITTYATSQQSQPPRAARIFVQSAMRCSTRTRKGSSIAISSRRTSSCTIDGRLRAEDHRLWRRQGDGQPLTAQTMFTSAWRIRRHAGAT